MKALVSAIGLLVLAVSVSAPAYGDAAPAGCSHSHDYPPPARVACEGLKPGDLCNVDGSEGTCRSDCDGAYSFCLYCRDAEGLLAGADESGGGCSTTPGTETKGEICAFLVAGSFSLLFLLRRRRGNK